MSVEYAELGDLREGSYIVIDGEPCRIVEISKAKTGKHGSAKVHVVAIGIFSGSRRSLVAPADQRVEVPIINKRTGQVLAITGGKVQVMDMETYETFELDMPSDPEVASRISTGSEVEYWEVMGVRKIMRVLRS
ncbi:MAG: translation initiation factor IF-5A [Desulfurococcaceae archaeon]|nr:translation initiation factor IF-5A [Desulfurococcaceae archaeon]